MKGRRVLLPGLVILIIAGLLVYGFWPKPRPVEAAKVIRGLFVETVDAEGQTRVIDRFVVSAPVGGFAQRIDLDVGDRITKNQTVAILEPMRSQAPDPRARAEAKARVAAARVAVEAAKEQARATVAEAELAVKERERQVTLAKSGFSTPQSLDKAWARVRTAKANRRSADFSVEVARYQLKAARTALAYTGSQPQSGPGREVTIKAPVAGRVLKVAHRSEGIVVRGEPLLEIGNPENLEVAVDVLSSDAVRLRPGMPVLFERWGGKETLKGRVRIIEPVGFTKVSALGVDEQRVWVISDIISVRTLWTHLGDGYRVEARFLLWEGENVLKVPESALFRSGSGWAVFVVNLGRAQKRIVTLGHRNGLAAQVLEGLPEGTTVIVHPDETIHEGVRVSIEQMGQGSLVNKEVEP